MQKIAFYGARSLALGMYEAVKALYPEASCIGFIVTSMEGNPGTLAGKKVWELGVLGGKLTDKEKDSLQVLIAVPEDRHREIVAGLLKNGFRNYICMDSRREARLMGRYYERRGSFAPLHWRDGGKEVLCVYQVRSDKDRKLEKEYKLPEWAIPLQAGAETASERICECRDNQGENISGKNANYCELTALYWIWKNRLCADRKEGGAEYYGLFHYRRILDIREEDLCRMTAHGIDVILPYPTMHEPDIREHPVRYVKEEDFGAMRKALSELRPEYAEGFEDILRQPFFYNYNLLIARRRVLRDYCEWLFPILERTEELSTPKGRERKDRYIGYLGESLETLYFLYNKDRLNIVHTGRIMLT